MTDTTSLREALHNAIALFGGQCTDATQRVWLESAREALAARAAPQAGELRAALAKAIEHGKTLATRLDAVTRDRDEKDVRHFNEVKALQRDRDNWKERAMLAAAPSPATPPAASGDAQSPSYDALLIIAQSVCGALKRAGFDDCDDPGEAIDVMREGYERRLAAIEAQASAPGGEVTDAEVEAAAQAISQRNQANRGVSYPVELCRADARAALTAAIAARTGKGEGR